MTLRDLRLSAGWTQARLSDALGVSAPYLSQVEAGAKPLPIERAAEIVALLGVPEGERDAMIGRLLLTHAAMTRGGA